MRGITIKHKKNKVTKVVTIEVQSELYDFDSCYQDITLDSEYAEWQKNQLTNLFKND